jgi:protein-tyrosine kinase
VSNIFGALRMGGASTADLEQDLPENGLAPNLLAPRTPAPIGPLSPPANVARVAESERPVREVRLSVSALAPVLPFETQNRRAAEQYQIVRTRILHHASKPRFVLISSASSGDGKTITSINIAASLALKADARVLLIDGDLRLPSVARTLGLPAQPGLSDVLTGRLPFEDAIVRTAEIPNLFILTAGEPSERPADLLDSERWRTLASSVRERFTTIICDAPPIATVADHELLQLIADGLIVVARPGHTNRAACLKALAGVDSKKMLGLVLNCVEDWWLWKTPHYGYYGQRTSL